MLFKVALIAAFVVSSANSQSAGTTVAATTSAPTPTIPADVTETTPSITVSTDIPVTTPEVLADAATEAPIYHIGGLFEPGTEHIENVFQAALDDVNQRRVLGTSRLKARVEELELKDSFQASQSVCSLLSAGVLALYGPQSLESTSHVQSMASSMQVPHLKVRVDFKPPGNHSVNMMPSPYVLARAFRDLVTKRNWRSFAIVYSDDESLLRIQEFLTEDSLRGKKMMIRRINPNSVKQVLQDMKFRGFRNILVDLSLRDDTFAMFMKAAQESDMMTEYYNYVSTSLDLESAEIPPTDASIASFSLIEKPSTYSAASALTIDAIHLFTDALAELSKTKPIVKPNLTCSLHDSWPYGHDLRQQILKTQVHGMTGDVKFDEQGIRSDIKLRLLENIGSDGKMTTVGSWSPSDGIRVDENHSADIMDRNARILKNKTLRVLTADNIPPMKGFLNDLMELLQTELGFKMTTEEESVYGVKGADGKWKGMVGQLVNGSADVALADLTITDSREDAIDFTVPFLSTGVSVLVKKSDVGTMTSVEDLANQDAIQAAAVATGSTHEFLKNSERTALNKIYNKMTESCPSHLLKNARSGLDAVTIGGTAFFTEQLQLQHAVNNNCDLTQLGDLLNNIGYGLGLQKGSPYTSLFSRTILKLKESGKIDELRAKHWAKNVTCDSKP